METLNTYDIINNIITPTNHNILDKPNIIIPLIYNDINNIDTYNIKNIILIHDLVYDYNKFVQSANSDSFPIVYNYNSSKEDLLNILNNFSNIQRIAFVFHNEGINQLKNFIDNKPLFTHDDLNDTVSHDTVSHDTVSHDTVSHDTVSHDTVSQYSDNLQFIIDIVKKFNITNLDFLACNTLQYQHWKTYYDIIYKQTNIIIGASNDLTGNIKFGGDWILESTNEDIRNIYFTDSIENYQYTLAATSISQNGGTFYIKQDSSTSSIKYSSNNSTWTTIPNGNWPLEISNTSSSILTVIFNTDITFRPNIGNVNGYFSIMSNNITIDGNNKVFTINGITNYPGLIQNGSNTNSGFTNIIIKNLGVITSDDPTLESGGGWVCKSFFGRSINSGTIIMTNCYSTGFIGDFGGGIFGENAGIQATNITITATNCYSTGVISLEGGGIFGIDVGYFSTNTTITATNCYSTGNIGTNGGGIFGSYAGLSATNNTTITATNCYSTGNIGTNGGGIFGSNVSYYVTNTTITATNCYSTGFIGTDGGGVFGSYAGNESITNASITATNCYSNGNIGEYAGGVFGSYAGNLSTSATITTTNCYSTGFIGTDGGGVFGSYAGNASTTTTINTTNCYSNGVISTSGTGIFGSNKVIGTESYCYSANNNWNDSTANNSLIINTNVWTDINLSSISIPYLLTSFNSQIYNPNSANTYDSYYTTQAGLYNSNYSLISVNNIIPSNNYSIDPTSGIITFNNLIPGNYVTKVLSYTTYNSQYINYNINNFTLNISFTCFKEDTKILTNKGYILIQNLRKGDLVKTLKNDFKPIDSIAKKDIFHICSEERIKEQLYKCSPSEYPEIFEPLIITGCHCILVDNFISKEQEEKVIEVNKNIYLTDNKFRLPALADPRASVYEKPGNYTIYHLALENDNYYMNYGIYANGLLVETCSKRYLKELSNMTLI